VSVPEPRKPNRRQQQQGRGHSHWCNGCDAALVNDGAKCRRCGKRQLPKRGKPRSNGGGQ
jgi:ribosomal protein L40E